MIPPPTSAFISARVRSSLVHRCSCQSYTASSPSHVKLANSAAVAVGADPTETAFIQHPREAKSVSGLRSLPKEEIKGFYVPAQACLAVPDKACSVLVEKGLECVYKTASAETHSQALKRKYHQAQHRTSQYVELYGLLATLSDDEAPGVLRRIRSGADVDTILNQIRAGDLLLQMALAPETRFRYEFPYISDMPEGLLSNNPYLDSLIYEAASLYSSPASHNSHPGPHNLSLSGYQSPYLKPLHSAEVIDPLLSSAKPSAWSTVCANDTLMRELLNVYLRCEYFFYTLFHKDYFLEDMASGRDTFCSSLLVNALLAYSCSCYSRFRDRAEYWNPQTLLYRFLAEAKRLWELEADTPRVTTVQAGLALNMVHNMCGLDKFGRAYSIQAVNLAHKLRLFDDVEEVQDQRTRDGRAFTL
ncbi:hypothetical protein NW759_004026 [Fusarium solani]|nr:hypothetical protein NW759_004026 [Fusarium solani]